MVVHLLLGRGEDFLVVVNLEITFAIPRFDDTQQAHNRRGKRLVGFIPICGPCKIGRINIRCQPFFKPMQLVRSDKVHLA